MQGRSIFLSALLWLGLGGSALAVCQGTSILYQDSFERLQPTWGNSSDAFEVVDSQLVVSPGPDAYFWQANSASLYDDVDMCVTITTLDGVEPAESKAGLIFWYVDANNFYVFELAPNGKASVWRRQRGRWLAQVEWKDAEGANTGDDAINELQVTTVGSKAVFTVNGKEFEELTGDPPDGGQQVGIFAASPPSASARFAFDNFKVTAP